MSLEGPHFYHFSNSYSHRPLCLQSWLFYVQVNSDSFDETVCCTGSSESPLYAVSILPHDARDAAQTISISNGIIRVHVVNEVSYTLLLMMKVVLIEISTRTTQSPLHDTCHLYEQRCCYCLHIKLCKSTISIFKKKKKRNFASQKCQFYFKYRSHYRLCFL